MTMEQHDIPKASDKAIKQSIAGFFRASNSGEAIDHEQAAEESESSADVIRRQKQFLADLGVLERESGGDYALTEQGQQLGQALAFEQEDDACDVMREFLREWDVTPDLFDDLGGEYKTKEDVRDSIAYITVNELSTRRLETGTNGLIDLYEWVGLLKTNADGEYKVATDSFGGEESAKSAEKPEPEESAESAPESAEKTADKTPTPSEPNDHYMESTVPESPVDISLELTGDEDPENVRQLILAIRLGLEQDLHLFEYDEDAVHKDGSVTEKSLDAFVGN